MEKLESKIEEIIVKAFVSIQPELSHNYSTF